MSMDVPSDLGLNSPAPSRSTETAATARILVWVLVTAAISFLGGILFAEAIDSPHDNDDFEIFWQSWDVLEREYYYGVPEDGVLIRGAVQGLLATTGDRYTFLVEPQRAELDRQMTAGEFGGIGAYVSQNNAGQFVITMPFNDYPAEAAGLEAGDVITAIDGTSIVGWTQDAAVGLLRGEIGTRVEVTVYRPDEDREFTVEIRRARVELPTVYATMYGDVGYVRLFSFNGLATELLNREIGELLDQGAQALIFDLRDNPGGLLDQAVNVSDLFLEDGLILTQRSRNEDDEIYRSNDGDLAEDVPLVVLINGGSASAAEVVAGALYDRERATLIGQTSFGKGLVQHVYDLDDGSQLHVTVSLWFTPNETLIQDQGLAPDITVDVLAEPDIEDDPYIDAALDYFATQGVVELAIDNE